MNLTKMLKLQKLYPDLIIGIPGNIDYYRWITITRSSLAEDLLCHINNENLYRPAPQYNVHISSFPNAVLLSVCGKYSLRSDSGPGKSNTIRKGSHPTVKMIYDREQLLVRALIHVHIFYGFFNRIFSIFFYLVI